MPEPKRNKGRSIKREILPKTITGEEFRTILIEKRESGNRKKLQKNKENEKEFRNVKTRKSSKWKRLSNGS